MTTSWRLVLMLGAESACAQVVQVQEAVRGAGQALGFPPPVTAAVCIAEADGVLLSRIHAEMATARAKQYGPTGIGG